ncbi:MAG: LamG-like jellyroll fold domain-containing protein [Bacillota bacterium]
MNKKILVMLMISILISVMSINASAFWFFDDIFGGGEEDAGDLVVWYKFDQSAGKVVKDSSGRDNEAHIKGGSSWTEGNIDGALNLNGENGYVQLPDNILAGVEDITISTWVKQNKVQNWQRIFDFGSGTDSYMFVAPNSSLPDFRFVLKASEGSDEELVIKDTALTETGEWKHIAVVLDDNQGIIYEDGKRVATSEMTSNPADLAKTTANYIGKSQYEPDPYFAGQIDDFRIYSRALSAEEIIALREEAFSAQDAVIKDKKKLDLGKIDTVTHDLELPVAGENRTKISWESSNPQLVTPKGEVTRPSEGNSSKDVVLEATISKGDASVTKEFKATILPLDQTAYTLEVNTDQQGVEISPTLYGAFWEDINYAADGGMYAEQIKNRSFEYEKSLQGWSVVTNDAQNEVMEVKTEQPLNKTNNHYLSLNIPSSSQKVGISNSGYWGILVEEGAEYDFSFYAQARDDFAGPIKISLQGEDGTIYGEAELDNISNDNWKKYSTTIEADKSGENAKLVVTASDSGTVLMDMISLFPEDTWQNRENGLRPDLVEMIDQMNPSFFRFPGGCIVEGNDLDNAYQWKETIGDLAERRVKYNLWGYYQSNGLGYHEYFQLSEDLGAEPVPILPAGLSCQARGAELETMNQLDQWIQDALDLIEYANGPVTSEWGRKRAENGHPEPFNLKYLGVGNENWGAEYYERYEEFHKQIKAEYPEIKLITSSGPAASDYNYAKAWEWLEDQPADIVDEHMYMSPDWFLDNADRYDNYNRKGPQVFLGEYAAHTADRKNNLEAALAEAAFMTGLERNSDVVEMAAYAPLFNNVNGTQWAPDLIWFNKSEVFGTPSYYVQQLFSNNVGDITLESSLEYYHKQDESIRGAIGLGSWETEVEYDKVEVVQDDKTLLSSDFNSKDSNWKAVSGDWKVENGFYKQTSNASDTSTYAGNSNWNNYTLNVRARKKSGSEGMIIHFGRKDENNYYQLNLGGWGNSQTALQKINDGSDQIIGKSAIKSIETNKWYDIKIELSGNRIRTYLDGELMHDVKDDVNPGPLYYVSSKEQDSGDIIIKAVNSSDSLLNTEIVVDGTADIIGTGSATTLSAANKTAENSFDNPQQVIPEKTELKDLNKSFEYDFSANSVTILRIKTK